MRSLACLSVQTRLQLYFLGVYLKKKSLGCVIVFSLSLSRLHNVGSFTFPSNAVDQPDSIQSFDLLKEKERGM